MEPPSELVKAFDKCILLSFDSYTEVPEVSTLTLEYIAVRSLMRKPMFFSSTCSTSLVVGSKACNKSCIFISITGQGSQAPRLPYILHKLVGVNFVEPNVIQMPFI